MKVLQISPHIVKVEAWFGLKMSAWVVKGSDGVYIVDTGKAFMGKRILQEAEQLGDVKAVLLTHGHSDHVGGLKNILLRKELPVYAHISDIKHMEGKEPFPGRKKKEFLVETGVAEPLVTSEEGALQHIDDLISYHTPGHSPWHVCYFHKEDGVLIGGDLFTSKKGRLKPPIAMFTADMKQAVDSGKIVNELKPDIVSICHGNDIRYPHEQMDKYLSEYA
ncbi:MBL fold metallo-hydrolase [Mesobacillus zeae]|uniref:MBL fold metallo-hydrolase n=1 Tax=Mesobacillus zeae TaxID=1917180 RepID=A0A398B1E3_9BACI|nr:MBL fold metallo-hydrolase [Mesobacillus zeae]RID83582.1 MBL fold metallo-hydrolase [Mesobacillus zeae]